MTTLAMLSFGTLDKGLGTLDKRGSWNDVQALCALACDSTSRFIVGLPRGVCVFRRLQIHSNLTSWSQSYSVLTGSRIC